MSRTGKLVNLSYLKEISNGNEEFIAEMIDMLLMHLPEYQNSLQSLYEKKEYQRLGKLAHKIKSALIMIGMEKEAEEMKAFEEMAKEEKNIGTYPKIIAKFVKESDLALNELRAIKETTNLNY